MRIGSVPYLNARPLVEWLEREPPSGVTLSYAIPSVLVQQLLAGELDIAMASTFPLAEHPELQLLPGLGVTTCGPTLSVRLLSKTPVTEIRRVALDLSSRSSVMLARVILADRYGLYPEYLSLPPDRDAMLAEADAAVLIGDIGIAVQGDGLLDLDLGVEWQALTGLPFYFAGWIARDPDALAEAGPLLHAACDYGLARLPEIARTEAVRLQLPEALCYRYLAQVMRYRTGPAEEAGLQEFFTRAARLSQA